MDSRKLRQLLHDFRQACRELSSKLTIYQYLIINSVPIPGILNVYVKPEDIDFDPRLPPKFTKSGNQGDEWYRGVVQLPKMDRPFQVL